MFQKTRILEEHYSTLFNNLVLGTQQIYFLPFMIYSEQFPSQLIPFHPQRLQGIWHRVLLHTQVCSLLLRNIFPLLNYLRLPFLLLLGDSHQGKPMKSISLIFISQIFTTLRLPKSGLMASVASSDLSCG